MRDEARAEGPRIVEGAFRMAGGHGETREAVVDEARRADDPVPSDGEAQGLLLGWEREAAVHGVLKGSG